MMLKRAFLFFALLLVACGAAGPPGDAGRGQKLFSGEAPIADGSVQTCLSCHPVAPGQASPIGNNLSNIGLRAGRTVPDQSAEEYLRTAILSPDAFLSGGFQEGIMYRQYRQLLTPQQISDLVAYLLTLRSGQD